MKFRGMRILKHNPNTLNEATLYYGSDYACNALVKAVDDATMSLVDSLATKESK